MSLTPWHDARDALVAATQPLTARASPVVDAVGRVTVEDVHAAHAVPSVDVSAMDGVAVRARDTPGTLPLVGDQRAGGPEYRIAVGEAVRIATGAAIPDGADCVVRIEDVAEDAAGAVTVSASTPGRDIRRAGSQITAGTLLAPAGTRLTAGHVALLLSGGVDEVVVHPIPRVGILVSGDEVVRTEPSGAIRIRDANGPMLRCRLEELGVIACDLGLVADDPAAIAERLREAADRCDAVIVTGGTSVGKHDHLHEVLTGFGPAQAWRLALRPAKPFVYGRVGPDGGVPVLCLPGNPNAARVALELLVRPVLARLAGRPGDTGWSIATLAEPIVRAPDGRAHAVPVQRTSTGPGDGVSPAGVADLSGLARADALLVVPDGDGHAQGDEVQVLTLRPPD